MFILPLLVYGHGLRTYWCIASATRNHNVKFPIFNPYVYRTTRLKEERNQFVRSRMRWCECAQILEVESGLRIYFQYYQIDCWASKIMRRVATIYKMDGGIPWASRMWSLNNAGMWPSIKHNLIHWLTRVIAPPSKCWPTGRSLRPRSYPYIYCWVLINL